MTLSNQFKLAISLGAIILFVVMFISLATQKKEEINEIDYEWCARTADVEAEFIRNGNETAESACELLASENCPQMNCDLMIMIERDEKEWYPGKLTASGDSQLMPELEEKTSHDRFKELAYKYGLNPSAIREVENKYNIREGVILAIIIAETSGGKFGYGIEGCWNYGNVGNNDRGDRYCFESQEVGLSKIGKTLSNQYLGSTQTLGCLSKAGSCTWWEDKGHIYASSDGNWERTMLNVLNAIYGDELGDIQPERFNVRRVFTIYQ